MCRNTGLIYVEGKNGYTFFGNGVEVPERPGPGMRKIDDPRIPLAGATVACRCPRGDPFRARFHTFDPATMKIPERGGRSRCDEILQSLREQGRHREADVYERFLGKTRPGDVVRELVAKRSPSRGPSKLFE
jgi:hypothetical protein